jgi:hypothetical protein
MSTDLASVPWSLWWLVASYGRHTRAALVHDSLIGDDAVVEVERKYADWVFLTALEDHTAGEPHGSWTRHQLMWAAVCLFGTMKEQRLSLMLAFLVHLILFWFTLVGALAGWLPFGLTSQRWLLVIVIGVLGFGWTWNPCAVRKQAWRLWPLTVVFLPLIAPAVILVYVTVGLIWSFEALPSKRAGRGWPPVTPTRIRRTE